MEDRLEYVQRQLDKRTQTLKDIAEKAKVSLRAIGYVMNPGPEYRQPSLKTINRLHQYFKGKK